MTESGTDSTILTWSVPECPFVVESSTRVLDDIRLAVTDAFFSLPRGGAEIGGILLGAFENGRLMVNDYAALECEHAFGPSFVLSPPDEVRLKDLLAAHSGGAGGLRPVGWYHSHTRSEIFLSDADLEIHKRFFPDPWQVALVMKPHTFQPARIGYFFYAADGSVRTNACYREDVLEALPLRQMPAGMPDAPPMGDGPGAGFRADSIAATATAPGLDTASGREPSPDPTPDLPVPQFMVESEVATRTWMVVGVAIVATLGVMGAGFRTRHLWLPQVMAAIQPAISDASLQPAPALGLHAIDHDGQLQILWDRTSPGIRRASDAILEIVDGGPLPVALQLDAAHLETGSFTYARTAEKVDVKLIVHQENGPDIREVTSFLGKIPGREAAKDAEAAAKQAADLKTALDSQAAKTKQLEKDVRSMREEMRQQKQRMNNQIPGR